MLFFNLSCLGINYEMYNELIIFLTFPEFGLKIELTINNMMCKNLLDLKTY